ncbi:MAG TPA: hypothetical protein PLZ08_13040 [Bacillota bacterium]|nr:hypothetical protein [Bacillota bacterium]HOL11053.1 hypothetical protein [Bacillota bacterium]HPO98865.1 hypothetical protein [Bacillota bacterium]
MDRKTLLKPIWLIIIFLLLGFTGCNPKVNSSRAKIGFGVERKKDQVYYYGLTGELEKTIDLKKKIVTYQNKTRQFFECYCVSGSPFYSLWSLRNDDRFLNALPAQKMIYYNNTVSQEVYSYNEIGLVKLSKFDSGLGQKYSYDQYGLLQSYRAAHNDINYEYEYNSLGLIIKRIGYSKKVLSSTILYGYNSNRQISMIKYFNADNEQVSKEIFYYNEQNQITRIESYKGNGKLERKVIYLYNPDDTVRESLYYDYQDQLYTRYEYTYNQSGNLNEEKQYDEPKGTLLMQNKLEYDNEGRLIKVQCKTQNSEEYCVYQYDD